MQTKVKGGGQEIPQVTMRESSSVKEKSRDENVDFNHTFLNIQGASEFTKLAKQTLYQLVSKRKVPFLKKNSRVIFEREELKNWLIEGKKTVIK